MRKRRFAAALAACTLAGSAWAQQPIIYPAKGQSSQQQSADMGDCQVWATQTTGVNPAAVAQQLANQPPPSQEQSRPPQPLVGMLGGAAIGGIVHGGEGAAVGALVGGLFGGWREHHHHHHHNQEQAAQQQARNQLATYNRAYGACMDGRGYVVR